MDALITILFDFFSSFFSNLASAFYYVANWTLSGIVLVVGYTFYVIFDGFLTVIFLFFQALDLSTVAFSLVENLVGLPPAMIYLIAQSGLAQGLTLLMGAYGIRKVIDLIPAEFTRF